MTVMCSGRFNGYQFKIIMDINDKTRMNGRGEMAYHFLHASSLLPSL